MLLAFVPLLGLALTSSALLTVHETRAPGAHPSLHGWTPIGRMPPSSVVPLRVGLRQQNVDRMEELLMSVSHPESPTYGQHWTPERIVDTFSPARESIAAVKDWLIGAGISAERMRLTPSRGWVAVNVTVEEAESLLDAEYHVFEHVSGAKQFGCHSYSVPAHLQPHIDLIKPTIQFNPHPNPRGPTLSKRGTSDIKSTLKLKPNTPNVAQPAVVFNLTTCDQFITPECIRALYNVNYTSRATKKNSFGIVEFTPQAFLEPDLDLFFTTFSPDQVGQRPIPVLIDGAIVQTTDQGFGFNGESDLDLEYAMALASPLPITLLQTGDIVEGAGFDNWLDAVDGSFCTFEGGDDPEQDGIYPDPLPGGFKGPESCGIVAPPHTVSISYAQDEVTISARSANRQCLEYAKLGILGTSVFYSSGDNGVAGNGGVCLNATHQQADDGTVFNPSFPSTCPFVTSVGATQITPGNTVRDPETACEEVIFSGGGFSNVFAIPSYQSRAVRSYLRNHPPPYTAGQFNNSGNVRAFPDLSANGANYVIGADGELELVFGTSASAPTTAAIFTLINDARIARGKRPVGFINPVIYLPEIAFAFNDIRVGGNQGCGTPGFNSTPGWDPVTGVGTPDFAALLKVFLALP